jgi:hypothetical protein
VAVENWDVGRHVCRCPHEMFRAAFRRTGLGATSIRLRFR